MLGFVRGVHARRSLAAGEIAAGRSDIDLTVVIDEPRDLAEESAWLRALARRLGAIRRVLPVIGPPEVATPAELAHWYGSPDFPATHERDRGWLRLWGEPFVRPAGSGSSEEERLRNLPWLFWAWLELPDHFRRGRLRTCCNLVLDMVDVRDRCAGRPPGPRLRRDVLADWAAPCPAERDAIAHALGGSTPRDGGALLRRVYALGLEVVDSLAGLVPALDGELAVQEVATRPPFAYRHRTWLLVEPRDAHAVEAALAHVARAPHVALGTPRGLAVQMRHRNPWEYFTMLDPRARAVLAAPPPEALTRAVRYYQHRIVPRRIGLAIGTGVDRSATLGAQIAQGRLWLEERFVATDREQLVARWRRSHGAWPWRAVSSSDAYFAREYAIACEVMDRVADKLREAA
jgi:hypothetical protein